MSSLPLITVILPVYNGEKYLRKSVDSILRQTYKNIELIAVNDCSTDNTLKILEQYALEDDRVKIINNRENLKLPGALNAGFTKAKGKYLTWTSDDNMYKDNAFEVLVNVLMKNPELDLVYSDYTFVDENDFIIGIETQEPDDIVTRNVCGACFMYTKRIADRVGSYDPSLFLAEDYDYWIRIHAIAKIFHLKNENLYYYRCHSDSLSETKQNKIAMQTFKTYKKNFKTMYSFALETNQEIAFLNKLCEYAGKEFKREAYTLIKKNASKEYKIYYRKEKRKALLNESKLFCIHAINRIRKPVYDMRDKKVNIVLNNKKNDYRYVHIIHNDKFCCSFVEFINEQFNKNEHMFIVLRTFRNIPFPKADNVYEFYRLENMDFSSPKIEKVILHSLFIGQLEYWEQHLELLRKKVYWMIWGADLYEAPRTRMDDLVRKSFYGYISDTDGDCKVAKEKYQLGNEKVFINAAYTFPITMEMIEKARNKHRRHDYVQIQINNSCDWTIIDMLRQLEKFKDKNIRIVCSLSYGEGEECKREIIKTGKELFGNKFNYLDKLCSPQDYAYWLADNDIYILNQNRQQGLGNSFASLALGAKLYIKSTVTTYHHFNDKGIKVYDTLDIQSITYEDLVTYDEDIKKINESEVNYFFDNAYLKKCWEPVFDNDR